MNVGDKPPRRHTPSWWAQRRLHLPLTRPLIRFLYIRHVMPDCFRQSLPPSVPISNYKNGLLYGNGTATEFKFLGL